MQSRNENNAQGIDVSHYQGKIDWQKVKDAGKSFVILKATEGTQFIDDTLQPNYTGAKAVGIAVGMYHFCRASNVQEAVAEARFFCNVLDGLGGIGALDIPPVLDIETVNAHTMTEITAICHAWLDEVEKRCGVKPMIYSFPWFAGTYLHTSLSAYKLWYADYTCNPPLDRCGFTEWTFLQYTDKGQVPGIGGPVDLNEFNGSVDDLMGHKISKEDADYIIDRWLSREFDFASEEDKVKRHTLANELRKASGQPITE